MALAVVAAMAQDTARLSATIADATGSPVPGALVELRLAGGAAAVMRTTTTAEGLVTFAAIRSGSYDLVIEASGFRKETIRSVAVLAGRELSLPPVRLEVGAVTESVEVTAQLQSVQTTNSEVSATVTNEQIHRLPQLNRSPLALMHTQAGVQGNGRSTTVINGQRTSFANVTLDGVNVQDNFIRNNALDFLPNLLLTDQIGEMTIVTSNAGAMFPGGSAQVTFVTPQGTNDYHGSLYWNNRNNHFAANPWFNNRDGVRRPFLNQNQGGGKLAGPIKKDKLLFFANYEVFRLKQQSAVNRAIPTADARQGIFTFRDTAGAVRKVNVLQLRGVQADPAMTQLLARVPGPENINNFRLGDSTEALQRNLGGYSFLVRNNRTRDNLTARADYIQSAKHSITGTWAWNRDVVDRPDIGADFSAVPKMRNDDSKTLVSVAWRSAISARLSNELRGGFNLAPGTFRTSEEFGNVLYTGMLFGNPVNLNRAQGRETNTYSMQDNATLVHGRHTFYFGYQTQRIRTRPYDEAGITPTYQIGLGTGNQGLVAGQIPGIGAVDLAVANALLGSLGGFVTANTQTFNVTSRQSGFVSGAGNVRNYSLDNQALYFQDNVKIRSRITLNLGLRWDYYAPVDERDALALLPVGSGSAIDTLLANSTLDFAGNAVGRRFYKRDFNNFGPTAGLAWDVRGNGRTAVRAGYSIGYVNDESVSAAVNSTLTNGGLVQTSTRTALSGRVSTGLPPITVPTYKVPRTFEENYRLSPVAAFGIPDPGLVMPYVQQWNIGIQHEQWGSIFELRYVGNHATKAWRAFDYNQVVVKENGFLADFQRAQNNANLALAAAGRYDPAYNSRIPGSQPLTVFPRLAFDGLLDNAVVQQFIRSGEVGTLAEIYQTNGLNGQVNFFRNRFALGTNMITNYSNSTYHALQFDVRRRFQDGLAFQANYTYGKVLSDAAGESIVRFEPFLDNENPKIERSRAPFDVTHQIKGNGSWDLPLWRQNVSRWYQKVLGGWSMSGIATIQSGTPFSILSSRGTLNRGGFRSAQNTAITTLNKAQLDDLFHFRMTGNGPYFVGASAIGSDGRAVAPDGRPAFEGQRFFHPGAGTIGSLQRRMFSGPWGWSLDYGAQKKFQITERQSVEFRMEAINLFNHATFDFDDQFLDSPTFGRVTESLFARRLIQFALYYRF